MSEERKARFEDALDELLAGSEESPASKVAVLVDRAASIVADHCDASGDDQFLEIVKAGIAMHRSIRTMGRQAAESIDRAIADALLDVERRKKS